MGNNEIWVKSSTDGGATWGNAVRLTDNAGNSQNPALARSGANVYVVWQDDVTGNNEIWLRSSSDGGATWGSAVRLTNNTGNSVAPDLKVSGNTLYVAWQDDVTGNNEIWVKSSTDGGATWGNAVRLSYNSGTYAAAAPVLAVNGSSVYVAWQDDLTGNNEIWLRSSSDGGATWGSAVRLTNNTGNSVAPDLKVSGNTLYVAWQDDVMGNNEIWVKSSSDGGATWGNAVRLTDNAGNSAAPVLGVSGNTVYVAWQDDVMGNNEIWLRSSPDGGATWGSEIRLTDNAGNSQAPVLAN